jgi:MFS family permease
MTGASSDATTHAVSPSEEIGEGVTLYPWYVVTVLMLAQTFSFIDRMIMGLLVGPVRASFGISDTQYSLLAGLAFAVFYAVMGLPLARIADSKSRRILIAVGISVWSLMTAMCGLAQGFWTLFLARVGVGVGEASLSPAAYSMITDYFSKKLLGRALSVYTVGVTVGSGLAYMIGSKVVTYVETLGTVSLPLVGEVEGWQMTFFVVGAPGLLIAALMVFTVKEPPRKGRAVVAPEQAENNAAVPIREVIRFLLDRKRAMLSHIMGMSVYIMVVFSLNVWGPTYLIRTFDYSRGTAGWVMGTSMILGGTLGLLIGGTLADKWYSKGQLDAYSRVILISALCALPFIVMLGFVGTPTMAIVCLSGAIFFSSFQGGISGGVIQLMTPNQMRGQAVALYFLFANLLGLGLGPTVVAATTDYVFKSDAAIGQSIALSGGILTPIAIVIMWSGLKQVRAAIQIAQDWH